MLIVETAPVQSTRILGFDTIAALDSDSARRLFREGLAFAISYVSLQGGGHGPLDAARLELLTAAGLAVMPVQFARTANWSAQTGAADGTAAARNALTAGIPAGTTIWCDLEGRIPSPEAAIAYANAWYDAALSAGAEDPGIYVGAGVPLSERELYETLAFGRYWRSLSQVPNVAVRGYQMIQLYPGNQVIAGVQVDLDVIQSDYLGSRPRWAVADRNLI